MKSNLATAEADDLPVNDLTLKAIAALMAGDVPGYRPPPEYGVTPPSNLPPLIIGRRP